MSQNREHRHSKPILGEKARQAVENTDENNAVIKMFLDYRQELDDKHDRYEKIVKLCRDITIENKRIIFLLHTINTDIEEKKQSVLEEANLRLQQVTLKNFKDVAELLKGYEQYQYQKAFTGGLQEFVEALLFYQFLKTEKFDCWNAINEQFHYEMKEVKFNLLFSQNDYILGIADFTGELMRRCINNLGVGNIGACFKICNFVKDIYTGFLGITNHGNKEMSRKLYVLRQSLSKMELVCYNIKIRGSEIPKHMLASVIDNDVNAEGDEGFY